MSFRLRTLVRGDVVDYRTLRLHALEESPAAFGASSRQEALLTVDELSQRISETPGRLVLGAFEEERLVGMVGFVRDGGDKSRHKGFIWGMFVQPEFRGRGLGRKLMEELLVRTDAMIGLRRVRLSVVTTNRVALKLYESFGFVRYGEEPEALCIDGIFHDEFHLVRMAP